LIGIGRSEEARQVIADMNGTSLDDPLVVEAMEELEIGIRAENEGGKATWIECFSTRNMLWKRTINGMMLQFIQQLNGQNFCAFSFATICFFHESQYNGILILSADYYYGDTFFSSAGTNLSPYVIQTILGGVSIIGTLPALHLIEAWGRRKSLLWGAILEAICAIVAGLVGHFTLAPPGTPLDQLSHKNKQGGGVLIAFAVLHVFSFGMFWGPT
jgi:MFS transporter, SP family, sugar:H+ symporter